MKLSPPIRFRIEWADSQGKVTASWLAAHFNFREIFLRTYACRRTSVIVCTELCAGSGPIGTR